MEPSAVREPKLIGQRNWTPSDPSSENVCKRYCYCRHQIFPFSRERKEKISCHTFLVWTQYSSYCHGIFNAQWPYFLVRICTRTRKTGLKKKTLYSIHWKCLRFYPRPMLKSVNLPPETGPIIGLPFHSVVVPLDDFEWC